LFVATTALTASASGSPHSYTRAVGAQIFRSTPRPLLTAPTFPPGFTDTPVITGLTEPTAVRFAADGRVFVTEKAGLVLEYDSLTDPTATTVKDLSSQVQNLSDRGLLGL